jgi:hypothetical protein
MSVRGYSQEFGSARLTAAPECELREVERQTTANGCTLVVYVGEGGDTYHEFIGPLGSIWSVSRREP